MDKSDVHRSEAARNGKASFSICPARRPPAPKGTMKVSRVWNAAGRRCGCEGTRSRFPGEECQHEQQSQPAPPFTPPCASHHSSSRARAASVPVPTLRPSRHVTSRDFLPIFTAPLIGRYLLDKFNILNRRVLGNDIVKENSPQNFSANVNKFCPVAEVA